MTITNYNYKNDKKMTKLQLTLNDKAFWDNKINVTKKNKN